MPIIEFGAQTVVRSPYPANLAEFVAGRCTVPNPVYQDILRYSPTGGRFTKVPSHLYYYSKNPDGLYLPRGLNVLEYLDEESLQIKYVGGGVKTVMPDLDVSPNDVQQEFLDALKKPSYRDFSGTYLFVSPPGSGKTISSLMAAKYWGRKTLILVNQNEIMDTWLRDIEKAFGGRTKPGIIQGPRFDIGEHFTVAMGQTLIKRTKRYPALWREIGTLIVDECDLVPASYFKGVISECPARYRLGITGTEKRKDGLHSVMYLLFGKPVHSVANQVTDTMVPVTRIKEVVTPFITSRTLQEQLDGIPEDPIRVGSAVARHDARNSLIIDNVLETLAANRTCLVSVVRREHAYRLQAEFMARNKFPQANPQILLGGDSNEEERALILSGGTKLVFSTAQYIQRGANLPPLDCLHIAGPMANQMNLRQLIGRIRRASPGKKDAWIYDYVDMKCPLLFSQFRRERVPEYRSLGVKKYKTTFYA